MIKKLINQIFFPRRAYKHFVPFKHQFNTFYQNKFCRSSTDEPDKILALILQHYIRELCGVNCGWGIVSPLNYIVFL